MLRLGAAASAAIRATALSWSAARGWFHETPVEPVTTPQDAAAEARRRNRKRSKAVAKHRRTTRRRRRNVIATASRKRNRS